MSTSEPHRQRLDQVAELLLEAADDAPPTAVGLVLSGEQLQLHTLPLVDVDQLIGFRAPQLWDAFGVCSGGTGRHLDVPGESSWRLTLVHLVHRRGHVVSLVRRQGDAPRLAPEAAAGRVPDLCLRVLGRPTPPPTAPVMALWDAVWLERILGLRLDRELGLPPVSWEEIVSCHPALSVHDRPIEPAPPTSGHEDRLVAEWESVRELVAGGLVALPDVTAGQAAWLDTGSFSRRALGVLPRSSDVLADLAELLPAAVVAKLHRCLGSCRHG